MARLEEVEQQLRWFKRQLFGAKSERRIIDAAEQQLWLGEAGAGMAEKRPAETTIREHTRSPRPRQDDDVREPGLRFDDSVPVETIEIEDPALAELDADAYVEISEIVTHRLAQRPGAYVVLRFVRKTVKCRGTNTLSSPPAPPSVLEKSYADVSFLAGMMIDKFLYYLPLYRQHQRLRAAGITVSRGSLSNWIGRAIDLLEPIYEAQLRSILSGRVVAMDETPIRAGRKAKGKMRTAYFWPVYGERDEVVFPYAPSRAQRYVGEILGDFGGTLVTDGYAAYDHFASRRDEVVHALCWVHARRGFVKSEEVEPELAKAALDQIGLLYEQEERMVAGGLSGREKLEARSDCSRPIVEALFSWLETTLAESVLLPQNPFTKAANYVLARRRGLQVFLGDPEVPLDTNHLERALRPIPMGRKNSYDRCLDLSGAAMSSPAPVWVCVPHELPVVEEGRCQRPGRTPLIDDESNSYAEVGTPSWYASGGCLDLAADVTSLRGPNSCRGFPGAAVSIPGRRQRVLVQAWHRTPSRRRCGSGRDRPHESDEFPRNGGHGYGPLLSAKG